MTEIFLKVLNLSIGAVPIMAALLVLRFLFKKVVPRKVFYIAWALVFLRLMVPFSLESNLSFFNFVPKAEVVEENIGTSVVFVENENDRVEFPVFVNPDRENPNVDGVYHSAITGEIVTGPDITTVPMDKNMILGTIWIFGTAGLLLFGIIGYFAVLRKTNFESVPYTKNIRLSDFFKTPIVCGLFRPKIILPMNFDLDDEAKVASVIAHECTHIRRKDNLWRLLATFTFYVHWFNPLVWMCYNAFIRDMEVSCDEEVLGKSKNDIRAEYAESLVALAGNGTNSLYGGVLSFGECAVKERVKCIMNFKKTTLLIIIICIAAAAALGVIFLTNPSAPVPDEIVETENYTIDGEKVAYFYDEKLSLDVMFENTGNKPLYISFNTEISYYSNAVWSVWFNNENYSGGAQLVAPGEKSNFFGTIDFSGREAGMAFDEKLFRIRREVFSDPELKESIGFAEWIFDIETYSGVVALGDFGTKFTPNQISMPKEVVFANEEQKKYCEELISSINYEELIRFYAESFPSDEIVVAEISRESAAKIIDWFKEIELVTCEPKNPNTGGGVSFYIETMDENIAISSNGGFFTICIEGEPYGYAFDAESCSGEFGSMWKIAQDALESGIGNGKNTYFEVESDETGSINEFEGFSIYSEIENTGEETIYLSFKYELATNVNDEWKVFSTPDTHPGSSQAISPGERAKFCEDLSSAYFMNKGLNYDNRFRIRREVFLDPELKESVGFAECFFNIKVRGTSAEVNPQPGSDDGENALPVQLGSEYLIPENEKTHVTLFNNENKTYFVTGREKELRSILAYVNIGEWSDNKEFLGKAISPVDTVEFARSEDGKKYTLSLYENGFVLNGSAVPEYQKGKTFIVQTENWGEFKRIVSEEYAQNDGSTPYYRPYWFGLINNKNVEHISVALNGENTMHYLPGEDCFEKLIGILKSVNIEPSSMKKSAGNKLKTPSSEYIYATVYFNTETSYQIAFAKDSVMMVSSDMNYGLSYDVIDDTYEDIKEYSSENNPEGNPATGKPVIYLYPEKETLVSVNLDFDGKITYTYPAINSGWKVLAKPDGTLTNLADNSTHYYLFWEGTARPEWTYEKGFVVKGSETEKFLRENLAKMGLTPREYNDFITYWVPKMQENPYNLISFSGNEYSEIAKLTVDPKPDSVIRIHMMWKALDEPIEIEPQVLPTYERKGFTLVEWGGTELF